jgi:hypothetical protein
MRIGRPTPPVVLTAKERLTLEQWARRPTTAQGLAQRARLVLACASSRTNGEIAAAAGVTRQTVGCWRHRFVRKRLPGLLDEPRPGAVALPEHVRHAVTFEDSMDRVSRHIDVVVPLQEEADPEGAVLPLAADLQDQGNDLWRGREGMVARAARPS